MTTPSPYVDDDDFVLYQGDALRVLEQLPAGSVDAVVTSPPYLDARTDVVAAPRYQYGDWSAEWLALAFRVLRPEGSLMLNLGRLHREGEELDYWIDVLARARGIGWKWLDTIAWHKVNGGGGKSSPYLIDRHEYVFWLAPSVDAYKGFDDARTEYSPATLERYQRRWKAKGAAVKGVERAADAQDGREAHPDGAKPGSVFTSSVGAAKSIKHPTPMDTYLARHLVLLSCPYGGVVLDPFAGSCTTAWVARAAGRRSVSIELEDEWCEEGERRMRQQALLLQP